MRARDRGYSEYGIQPDDVRRVRDYCRNMEGVGYDRLDRKRGVPAKSDDFYAYQRKTVAEFYDWLRLTGRWNE